MGQKFIKSKPTQNKTLETSESLMSEGVVIVDDQQPIKKQFSNKFSNNMLLKEIGLWGSVFGASAAVVFLTNLEASIASHTESILSHSSFSAFILFIFGGVLFLRTIFANKNLFSNPLTIFLPVLLAFFVVPYHEGQSLFSQGLLTAFKWGQMIFN